MSEMRKYKPRRMGVGLHVYIDQRVVRELEAYVSTSFPRVQKTAVVEAALTEFLQTRGHRLFDEASHARIDEDENEDEGR